MILHLSFLEENSFPFLQFLFALLSPKEVSFSKKFFFWKKPPLDSFFLIPFFRFLWKRRFFRIFSNCPEGFYLRTFSVFLWSSPPQKSPGFFSRTFPFFLVCLNFEKNLGISTPLFFFFSTYFFFLKMERWLSGL